MFYFHIIRTFLVAFDKIRYVHPNIQYSNQIVYRLQSRDHDPKLDVPTRPHSDFLAGSSNVFIVYKIMLNESSSDEGNVV